MQEYQRARFFIGMVVLNSIIFLSLGINFWVAEGYLVAAVSLITGSASMFIGVWSFRTPYAKSDEETLQVRPAIGAAWQEIPWASISSWAHDGKKPGVITFGLSDGETLDLPLAAIRGPERETLLGAIRTHAGEPAGL